MKIMVFDVPATNGGALTILNQYYKKAIKDRDNEWYFVISTPNLKNTENVKVLKYPWVKKSWIHRFYFDKFMAKEIINKYEIDEILSLQNITIDKIDKKQTLYLHQPLPFVEKKYRLTEDLKLWSYQNIISKMIFKSVKNADSIIVQTNWMKEACVKKTNCSPRKIKVIQPDFEINIKNIYSNIKSDTVLFFYPASGLKYKNHKIIVEAAELLKEKNILNYKIVFTLKGNENDDVKNLYNKVNKLKLPIEFIGSISLDEVYNYYSKCILIFPSYIETFGLPLLEAKMHGCPILASDCEFSHEILEKYHKANFFNPFDKKEVANLIELTINNYKIQ
ncbi:glycosyltransferase [Paraclostridium bifermentans]|uniref:glycosyltransferase n=1 Tax=Paraclostridium bifermentans TaxID=1490 RepID=UPI0025B09A82|nr:glycosyltransferase [Paraclostridium bifermentans]